MGLFSRSNGSKSNHNRNSSRSVSPGLTPISPVPRNDGKGDTTQASNAYVDVGVTSDCNSRYRKTMEDASVVIMDFMDVPGSVYFGIYDGHAGAQCATAVADRLHGIVADVISSQPEKKDIPLALANSFERMDEQLRTLDIRHSGSTAVVAITCYMNANGEIVPGPPAGAHENVERKLFVANVGDSRAVLGTVQSGNASSASVGGTGETPQRQPQQHERSETHHSTESLNEDASSLRTVEDAEQVGAIDTKRLSYDHRCGDPHEQRRVSNAGGIMINNRVNGMLAVTRSLGDLFMKDYVVGAPYTTETTLAPDSQEILVMACDGLWDVCSDAKSIQLAYAALREGDSALDASQKLLAHAISEFSVDNLTVMVVNFKR